MGSLTEDPAFLATTFVVIDYVIRALGVSQLRFWFSWAVLRWPPR